jgi:hypothetical protein
LAIELQALGIVVVCHVPESIQIQASVVLHLLAVQGRRASKLGLFIHAEVLKTFQTLGVSHNIVALILARFTACARLSFARVGDVGSLESFVGGLVVLARNFLWVLAFSGCRSLSSSLLGQFFSGGLSSLLPLTDVFAPQAELY